MVTVTVYDLSLINSKLYYVIYVLRRKSISILIKRSYWVEEVRYHEVSKPLRFTMEGRFTNWNCMILDPSSHWFPTPVRKLPVTRMKIRNKIWLWREQKLEEFVRKRLPSVIFEMSYGLFTDTLMPTFSLYVHMSFSLCSFLVFFQFYTVS